MSNPLISLLVGIIVTAIIQSCSASIGILQALSITGIIGYEVAIPMVIGMCIGACVPVLISAMGANVNGRRAAFVYLYFNLTGAVLLMIPFYILHTIIGFDIMSATATSFGIAIVNTIFKVSATVLLAPFAKVLEKIALTTIKDKKGKKNTPSLNSKETILQRVLPDKSCDFCRTKQLMHASLAMQGLGKNCYDHCFSLQCPVGPFYWSKPTE